MARTKTYTKKVSNRITSINRKLRGVEKTFGADSEQYRRYINAATAALPSDVYTLTGGGYLHIHGGKSAAENLKLGQLEALGKLPTAKKSMDQSKKALAQNKLRAAGVSDPTQADIAAEAVSISDEEALEELAAKSFIQNMENAKGKLKYDDSVRAELATTGVKSYKELQEIIKRGQANVEKRRKKTEYQRRYRATKGREEINRKQREYRARNRAEVNRKQREYRARRRAAIR